MTAESQAQELLAQCVAGTPPAHLPPELLQDARALFSIFVEGLGDRFQPHLCDAYADLFSQAIDAHHAATLAARYRRIRVTRRATAQPDRVLILSRVTLGADVAVTSVVLDAAKRAFPHAPILFAGPRKNFELFEADPRLTHCPIEYRRGTLRDRLAVWDDLKPLATPGTLILDPDSRLTQLGLLPLGEEHLYHLFESRSYGADTTDNLPALTARWAQETLGIAGAAPYIAVAPRLDEDLPPAQQRPRAATVRERLLTSSSLPGEYIAVSLGVGENAAKRIPGDFETQLLALLSAKAPLIVDRGAGGEEAERVARAVAQSGACATFWEGSFAGFADLISRSSLYVGYDSAGQHVAAACGIPLVTVFAGFPAERMFYRWRPAGPRAAVIRVDHPNTVEILAQVAHAIA